jgi:uncharacterized protein DUF2510
MDDAPGWRRDPEHEGQERYWSGSAWTDLVRPAGSPAPSTRLPEHVPQLQRALAAATDDIDAVEDLLSSMFKRTNGNTPGAAPARAAAAQRGPTPAAPAPAASPPGSDDDELLELDVEEPLEDGPDAEAATAVALHSATDLDGDGDGDGDGADADAAAFAELDAALAIESAEDGDETEFAPDDQPPTPAPEPPPRKRRLFRRRS